MPALREWNCRAHGEFENRTGKCPSGCDGSLVTQEIRTAPYYQRSGASKFVDGQLKAIAAEHGLSDMRNDPKGRVSVMQMEQRKRELAAQKAGNPYRSGGWVDVPHAKAGFSRSGDKAPVVTGASFGTPHSCGLKLEPGLLPAPKPMIVLRSRDL